MPDRLVCTIVNMSDPYTLVADDFRLAAVAVLLLGQGHYGLSCGELHSPVLLGWEEWLVEQGIDELHVFMDANLEPLATILETVLIGDEKDRAEVESCLAWMPKAKRAGWLAERHDRRRSSMNDIGGRAASIARHLRELAEKKQLAALESPAR